MQDKLHHLIKTLGPGILFASTCVGVSHLVQSTRAGADYGFAMLWAVIIANVFKFPFFEFAARYTSATGVSILDGYYKKGKWILWAYLLITLSTMFTVTAAVTFVTAGLLGNLMEIDLSTDIWALIILGICVAVLSIGRYSALDKLLKVVATVLVISTITAFVSAIYHGRVPEAASFVPKDPWSITGFSFLIALMGWMPTAVDISTWTSLWAEARMKQTGYRPTLKETLLDFNVGYGVSAVLAMVFLTLGAMVIYGSGTELSNSSPVFAGQVISLYTKTIGNWSYFVIAIAAFSTMFSTTITVIDGYGRAMNRTVQLLFANRDKDFKYGFVWWIVVVSLGGYVVIAQFLNNLRSLVDLATILSFVVGPLAAFINYKVIFSEEVKAQFAPPKWLKGLAIVGMVYLAGFTLIYFYVLA